MGDGASARAASVLGVLADLSPSAQQRAAGLAIPLDWFRWLPVSGVALFQPAFADGGRIAMTPQVVTMDRGEGERLAAIDRIRPEQRSLRVGWLFVAGRRPVGGGRSQRVFHPLLSVPVRIVLPPLLGQAQVVPAGDVSVTDLVTDQALRRRLEAGCELGGGALDAIDDVTIPPGLLERLERLRTFAVTAAGAAGFEARVLRRATAGPEDLLRSDGLCVVAGVGIFTATEIGGLSAAESLRTWSGRQLPDETAFSALYLGTGASTGAEPVTPGDEVLAPFPLTPSQRRAVSASRTAPVSVVSGAAGTGKSHTVSAIACDAVGRGETVLVAAKSDAAVDALLVLLGEAPGLEPVVFGSSERRDRLARRLAAGEIQPCERDEVRTAARAVQRALAARRSVADTIARGLLAEAAVADDPHELDHGRLVAPGLFDPACDLAAVRRLLSERRAPDGWWARRRARRARRQVLGMAGAAATTADDDLAAAAELAARARSAGDLLAAGGLELSPQWARLEQVEAELDRDVGRWLALTTRSPERLDRSSLAAVAVLATALRSGRAARRDQLARLDRRLTRALPLWVGTLGDVEDLLPPTPNLFDLVILDEASTIDQPLAAPALLRARRTVVVGDPHQLRHVSFLPDAALQQAAADHGLLDDPLLVGRLDVRRNSTFDVAVGAAPATVLDEHFRSAPHLIDFVARRLYRGRLHVSTRSPASEDRDCIEVVRAQGERDGAGVVRSEVDEVVARLRAMARRGVRGVGVVTPVRAQADALEAAVLEGFSVDELEALDLRVGTVHAFQGNERDTVLVSMGIGRGDGPATWRFAEDPHLFAVLATRARRHLVLLLSADPPPGGLIADYLEQVDAPPGRSAPAGAPGPWVASVQQWLASAGVPALPHYPAGRHVVDVCAGDERRFVGLECTVHPHGPAAHVERHLALRRAGWELVDAYPSRWRDRQGELVLELTERLAGGPPGPAASGGAPASTLL